MPVSEHVQQIGFMRKGYEMKKVLSLLLMLCMLLSSQTLFVQSIGAAEADVSDSGADSDPAETGSQSGKVLYVVGDSIALGYALSSSQPSWFKYVVNQNGYDAGKSRVFGEYGLGYSQANGYQNYIATTDFSGADIVVVALGINDWYNNQSRTDFFNAMQNSYRKIRSDNPDCELYCLLPFNISFLGNYDSNYGLTRVGDSDKTKLYSYTLRAFGDAMIAKLAEPALQACNIHLIDMMTCAAINRDTIRDNNVLPDKLHPNAATQIELGKELSKRLSAHGHLLTEHEAAAATCSAAGSVTYWSCGDSGCGKFFSDANADTEIAQNSWVTDCDPDVHTELGQPNWVWTGNDADGYTAASVTVTCSACHKQETLSAIVTKSYTTENIVYTAAATASNGQVITDTKLIDGQVFVAGHSLSLQGDIGVNFYFNLTAEQAANAEVSFSWNVDGNIKTSKVDLSHITKSNEGYKATCNVAPAEMTYDITATLKIGGEVITSESYSALHYADRILTDEDFRTAYVAQNGQAKYNALTELIRAMLDYGSRAQVRFDRNKDHLANGGNYTFTDAVDPQMIPDTVSKMSRDLSDYGLQYTGSTVVLSTNISIRHYYLVKDQSKFDLIKKNVTFNGEKVNHGFRDGEIYYEMNNISAKDFDTVYTLHIGNNKYRFTVFDYIRSTLEETDNTDEKTQALASAMYYYNQKANTFFGEPNVEPEHYEWTQTSAAVRGFLENANYNPSDYSGTVITDYAPAIRSIDDEHPSGLTIKIKQAGTLTIDDYSKTVKAGSYTIYNVVPNSSSTFTVTDGNGRILQWGTVNPTHFLRQLNIPAGLNARDFGGWACDGGTVKYGMIIRGGWVTPADRDVLVNQCGIRTDIELRGMNDPDWDHATVSKLGEDISYHAYDSYAWYSFTNTELCSAIVGDVIESVLNDKPVYIHCGAGADRTGTMVFILKAILGISQSDLDMDYELTTFHTGSDKPRSRTNDGWIGMINQIKAKSGATFRDKAVQCVLDLGISIDDINAFRAKMIDGTPEILTAN